MRARFYYKSHLLGEISASQGLWLSVAIVVQFNDLNCLKELRRYLSRLEHYYVLERIYAEPTSVISKWSHLANCETLIRFGDMKYLCTWVEQG